MAQVGVDDMENLKSLKLEPVARERLVRTASELTFSYTNSAGWPSSVVMSFVEIDGAFWVTAAAERPHVTSLAADPRVAITISNAGTSIPGRQMLSLRCIALVNADRETVDWYIDRHIEKLGSRDPAAFRRILDSPNRVVVELHVAGVVASHDSTKLPGDGRGDLGGSQGLNIRPVED